jgi:tRNA(Ile)-lysidine synthase
MSSIAHASLAPLAGHRVAVAVSGGADSVALSLWLHAHSDHPPHHVTLAGLIHVNHHLRGAESDRDETFCRALALRLQVPIEVVDAPIAALGRRSPEATARTARYRAFAEAADRLAATCVATAHTADDQAETVLLRLLRGTTNRGLSGIRATRGRYVRPFLGSRRADLRAWLLDRGESWCEDSTNTNIAIARNRVRHDLLPIIEQMAPGGVAALARAAALAEEDEHALHLEAIKNAPTVVLQTDASAATLDLTALRRLVPAIRRRVVRQVVELMAPRANWTSRHIDAVVQLATRHDGGGQVDLPGIHVERVSNQVRLRVSHGGLRAKGAGFSYTLSVPGSVVVPEAGVEIFATRVASKEQDAAYSLVAPADTVLPLTVRSRQPGDRMRLKAGTRKLQDLMVDAKIPRSERDAVPLVVAADGQILWGIGVSGARREADGTHGGDMVVLRFRKLECT